MKKGKGRLNQNPQSPLKKALTPRKFIIIAWRLHTPQGYFLKEAFPSSLISCVELMEFWILSEHNFFLYIKNISNYCIKKQTQTNYNKNDNKNIKTT